MWHFFYFNDTATTEIYTLSLHDALPIFDGVLADVQLLAYELVGESPAEQLQYLALARGQGFGELFDGGCGALDRKSTRLNSSHANISYAVFCLKKNNCTLRFSSYHPFVL